MKKKKNYFDDSIKLLFFNELILINYYLFNYLFYLHLLIK